MRKLFILAIFVALMGVGYTISPVSAGTCGCTEANCNVPAAICGTANGCPGNCQQPNCTCEFNSCNTTRCPTCPNCADCTANQSCGGAKCPGVQGQNCGCNKQPIACACGCNGNPCPQKCPSFTGCPGAGGGHCRCNGGCGQFDYTLTVSYQAGDMKTEVTTYYYTGCNPTPTGTKTCARQQLLHTRTTITIKVGGGGSASYDDYNSYCRC